MNKKFSILFIVLTLALATMACEGSATTANIKDAYLSQDEAGGSKTTVFGASDVIYCIAELANAPDDTVTKAVWTAVEVEGVDPNMVLVEKEITSGSDTLTFNLSNDQGWPAGKYKVDLLVDDKPAKTLEFSVQ